jgi:CHAT domain-containing protein
VDDDQARSMSAGAEAIRELLSDAHQDVDDVLAAIERRPALLSVEVDDTLGNLIATATERARTDAQFAQVRLDLERLRRTLRDCRVNGVETVRRRIRQPLTAEATQEMLQAAGLGHAADIGRDPALLHWREASLLLELERNEEATAHLEAAARLLHERGGNRLEGDVELELCRLARGDRASGDLAAAVRHAERAEAAYRRAGYRDGRRQALIILIVDGDMPIQRVEERTNAYLDRLTELDAGYGSWFRRYVQATRLIGSAPAAAAEELRWCADSVALLGTDQQIREHWRSECARKLTFVSPGTPMPDPAAGSATDHFLTALLTLKTQGDETAAAAYLAEALRLVEKQRSRVRSEVVQRDISATRSPIYNLAASVAHQAGRLDDAVDILERNTNRSLLARRAINRLWVNASPPVRSLSGMYQAQAVGYLTDAEGHAWADGTRQQLLTSLQRLRESVASDDQDVIRTVPPPHPTFEPVSTALVATRLADDDIVLVYSPIGHIYRITRDGVAHVAAFEVDAVEQFGADYRRYATKGGDGDGAALERAAAHLATTCVAPVLSHLAGKRRVMIVPCGALWTVPLAVLGPQPLASTHVVAYVPSLSLLVGLLDEPWRPRRVERFAGIGDPDGSLPHAVAELRRAATGFYDPTVRIGADIDEATLFADLPDADVIHFACHGIAFDEYPDLAALHLGGAGRKRRLLWTPDVARLWLRARLVVLAACHAGLSTALPGNEYAGLPGAFLTSGARTVVGPLWRVDDRVTATLMDRFYAALPAGPAVALRRAQEAVRADSATTHPYYWAAFQLFGLP